MRIGHVAATPVIELDSLAYATAMFDYGDDPIGTGIEVEQELGWMAANCYDPVEEKLLLSHHAWLLDTGRLKVLIDPCIGNNKPRAALPDYDMLDEPWLERLAAAGAAPEDVDLVFCTHLHPDHCGWNTRLVDGRWVPTFPNALYVFSADEKTYWSREELAPDEAYNIGVYDDSVRPVVEAGQAMVIEGGAELAGCLDIEIGAGHTPGHLFATLRAEGDGVVFAGDILHHPLQVLHPAWNTRGSWDPAEARASRETVLSRCADLGYLLAAAHFRAPYALPIERTAFGGYAIGSAPLPV